MGTQLAFDWRQIIHSRKNIALLGLFFAAFIIAFFALVWTHRLDIQQTSEATANAAVANYAEYNLDTLSKTQKPLLANLDDQNSATGVIDLGIQLDQPDTTRNGLLSLRTAQLEMRQRHYKALNTMPLPPLHQLKGDVLALTTLKKQQKPAVTAVSTSVAYLVTILPYLSWLTGAAAVLLACDSWVERRRHQTLLPLWEYLLIFMALTLLAGIWIISFSMLINTWITNAYLTTFIVTATALLPLILPQLFRFVWFLPFSYLDVAAMMRGTLIDRLNQPLASIWIGTGALFIWSVLNLGLFGYRARKEAA